MLRYGWSTGTIISRLAHQIHIINVEQCMHSLTWQQVLMEY
jgi:hypothetical protein